MPSPRKERLTQKKHGDILTKLEESAKGSYKIDLLQKDIARATNKIFTRKNPIDKDFPHKDILFFTEQFYLGAMLNWSLTKTAQELNCPESKKIYISQFCSRSLFRAFRLLKGEQEKFKTELKKIEDLYNDIDINHLNNINTNLKKVITNLEGLVSNPDSPQLIKELSLLLSSTDVTYKNFLKLTLQFRENIVGDCDSGRSKQFLETIKGSKKIEELLRGKEIKGLKEVQALLSQIADPNDDIEWSKIPLICEELGYVNKPDEVIKRWLNSPSVNVTTSSQEAYDQLRAYSIKVTLV